MSTLLNKSLLVNLGYFRKKILGRHSSVTIRDIPILFHHYFGSSSWLSRTYIILAIQCNSGTFHCTVSISRMFHVLI